MLIAQDNTAALPLHKRIRLMGYKDPMNPLMEKGS